MTKDTSSTGFQNRREFFRVKFNTPLRFTACSASAPKDRIAEGASQNVSQSGILFRAVGDPPPMSSIVWMDVDLRTLKICQEIEARALVTHNGLLGRVVRVEEDPKNNASYDVGVCFLTHDQKDTQEVQKALAELSAR